MAITMILSATVNGEKAKKGQVFRDLSMTVERKLVQRGYAVYGVKKPAVKTDGD